MSSLVALLPPDMAPTIALMLVAASFLTSMITAMLGLGGGLLMLAIIAVVLPPAVVLPVHGFVQFGSNFGRSLVLRSFIQWRMAIWFCLGVIIGSLLGANLAVALPEDLFRALIGLFLLFTAWGPKPRLAGRGPVAGVAVGTGISFLGMIIGATGPLAASFLGTLPDRRQLVATHGLLMAWSNLMKVVAFALVGFAFATYMPLVAAMMTTGLAGTFVGSKILVALPESLFRVGFKLLLTLVALQILWIAFAPALG